MSEFVQYPWILVACASLLFVKVNLKSFEANSKLNIASASITYSYREPNRVSDTLIQGVQARYAYNSPLERVSGQIVRVRSEEGFNHGCDHPVNVHHEEKWVALVERGGCKFGHKMFTSAVLGNASAVIVYNNLYGSGLVTMEHMVNHVVSVFMSKEDGERIAALVDSGLTVNATISVGQIIHYKITPSRKSGYRPPPVLYVAIGLAVLLMGGLIVLLLLGLHRTRYAQRKPTKRNIFTLGGRHRTRSARLHENLLSTREDSETPGEAASAV